MTVVAAIARDGHIVMAADTATNYCGTYIDGAVKIRRITLAGQPGLLAVGGDGALASLVQRNLNTIDEQINGLDPAQQPDAIASAATELAANQNPPILEDSRRLDGAMLLGWRSQLHYIFTHQAAHIPDGIAALGTGCDISLGTMHTALKYGATPEHAVRQAVTLACRYCEGCAVGPDGPHVLRLPEH